MDIGDRLVTRNVTKLVTSATRRTVVVWSVMMDIGESIVTRNVTYIVMSATRRTVVACCVIMDIGESIVTRNVTHIVMSATRRTVVVWSVMMDIGEKIVNMNVAIPGQIARVVKWKMESASGVNQDFGVTTVERTVVLDVQSIVRSRTEFVRHA